MRSSDIKQVAFVVALSSQCGDIKMVLWKDVSWLSDGFIKHLL